VGAIARQELVTHLLRERDVALEHLRRQESLEEVVVAAVALAAREPEHSRVGGGLEHGSDDVRRDAEPVDQRSALALEVERRERPVRPDPLEHALDDVRVLGEDARRARAPRRPEPRVLARQDEREPLVGRLEDLAPLVEELAPARVVAGDARVEDEVVVAAGDRERVELHRPPAAEDLERAVRAALERARGGEHVACDEKSPRVLGSDVHEPGRYAPGGRSVAPAAASSAGPNRAKASS
jgi:hypothetical protein